MQTHINTVPCSTENNATVNAQGVGRDITTWDITTWDITTWPA